MNTFNKLADISGALHVSSVVQPTAKRDICFYRDEEYNSL